jgi:TRAP-type mannitol/chloroaromatic compound transport system permease small subunit
MRIVHLLERVTSVAAALGACLILPLVAAMVFEVSSRYLFAAPTSWAYEVSYMFMAAIFMMGIAYALKVRQHVNVDLVYGALGPRARAIVDLIGYCLLLPCVAWLTYALYGFAHDAWRTGEQSGLSAWNPVIWPYRAILALGFAIFVLQVAAEVVKSLRALVTNAPEGR